MISRRSNPPTEWHYGVLPMVDIVCLWLLRGFAETFKTCKFTHLIQVKQELYVLHELQCVLTFLLPLNL